jgi:DNA-binding response OmpR family regulator
VTTALPRVLLVEDDASIRRFVAMALEELPIELVEAGTLAEAEAVLASGPLRLVISDLMLPDGSGMALLQALAADPVRRQGARLAAFSAGISAERRAQLEALGVDEVISKPASLAALEDCVRRALEGAPAAPPGPAPVAADVVARHFGGDQALYDAFSDACYGQFTQDLRQGDAADAAADLPGLRRLAHSLKSVLQTLGHDDASRAAAALETLAAEGDRARAPAGWARLRGLLAPLAR